jgi:hypothetical protein
VAEGMLALERAAARYDPTREASFGTFAAAAISNVRLGSHGPMAGAGVALAGAGAHKAEAHTGGEEGVLPSLLLLAVPSGCIPCS